MTTSQAHQPAPTAPTPAPSWPGIRALANPFSLLGEVGEQAPLETDNILSLQEKHSSTNTLSRKSGYYIVPYSGKFFYLKLEVPESENDYLFRMKNTRPSVFLEGLVVIDGEVYYVTHQDLSRGVVRKSRKLKLKRGTITYEDFITGNIYPIDRKRTKADPSTSTSSENIPVEESESGAKDLGGGGDKVPTETVSDFDISNYFKTKDRNPGATGKNTVLDESEAIDLAFKNQVGTLLDHAFEKEGAGWEEWEIEEDPQSE